MKLLRLIIFAVLLASCASQQPALPGHSAAEDRYRRVVVHYSDAAALERLGVAIVRRLPGLGLAEVKVEQNKLPVLEKAPGIVEVEAAGERQLFGSTSRQATGDEAWYRQVMGLDEAWSISRGCGVVVAVLDEWPDADHPDLAGKLTTGYDAFSRQEVQPQELTPGVHGTHVTGLIVADGRAKGAAPCARVMPVRVFDEMGYVGDAGAAEALLWAVDHGAQVINLSWGGMGYSTALALAVEYALQKGVVIVAAAGNEGVGLPSYPAAYPGVVAIAATEGDGYLAPYSSFGYFVSLAAPGRRIFSTVPGAGYQYLSGTSMASPLVAGSTALMLALRPGLDAWQVVAAFRLAGPVVPGHEELHLVTPAPALRGQVPEPGGCLKVRVNASNGAGVRLADVKLVSSSGRVYWTKTDGYGRADLRSLEPGRYLVQVAGPEWPQLKAEERVVASREALASPTCPMVDLVLQSDLWVELSWDSGDVDLAVKEGYWAWATVKDGARFGVFEGGDATDGGSERYRFEGGLSESLIRFGAVNRSRIAQKITARVHLNGKEWVITQTLAATDDVQVFSDAWVLGGAETGDPLR